MNSQEVWYRLVYTDGTRLPNTDDDLIEVIGIHQAAHATNMKHAVWQKNRCILTVDASNLKVYKNKESFDAKVSLAVAASIAGLGVSQNDPVLVLVPQSMGGDSSWEQRFSLLQVR